MITESDIYWITRLDHIRDAMTVFGIFSCILGSAAFIAMGFETDVGNRKFSRFAWFGPIITLLLFSVCMVALPFIPTTKEMCAIKVIPMVANNEDLRGLGTDIVGLAREWVSELRGTKLKDAAKQELEK